MADLRNRHRTNISGVQNGEDCDDGMLGEVGNRGDQGEDDNNDADSSDDESIIAGENENNISTVQPNSGNDDRNRQQPSERTSREDSFVSTRLVLGGAMQQHTYMMTIASVLHPERRCLQHGR
jgi:hypothetical protein